MVFSSVYNKKCDVKCEEWRTQLTTLFDFVYKKSFIIFVTESQDLFCMTIGSSSTFISVWLSVNNRIS